MDTVFTLSALAEIARTPKRAVQLWADAGVIKANPSTMLAGSGVHRRFKRDEAMVACIIAPFAKQKMAIGALLRVAQGVRGYQLLARLDGKGDPIESAASNEANLFLMVYWTPGKNGELSHVDFNLINDVFAPALSFYKAMERPPGVTRDAKPIKVDIIPLNEALRDLPAKL